MDAQEIELRTAPTTPDGVDLGRACVHAWSAALLPSLGNAAVAFEQCGAFDPSNWFVLCGNITLPARHVTTM